MTRTLALLAAFGLFTTLAACEQNMVEPPQQEAGEALNEESTGQIYQ